MFNDEHIDVPCRPVLGFFLGVDLRVGCEHVVRLGFDGPNLSENANEVLSEARGVWMPA